DLLPVDAEIPQIIRVANANPGSIPLQSFIARIEQKSIDAKVLIRSQKMRAEEPHVSTQGPADAAAGGITAREDAADVGLFQDVALDARDAEILRGSEISCAGAGRQQSNVVRACFAG